MAEALDPRKPLKFKIKPIPQANLTAEQWGELRDLLAAAIKATMEEYVNNPIGRGG